MEQLYNQKTSVIHFAEEKEGDFLADPREVLKDEQSDQMIHRIIVWFRNDLRVHDNYLLRAATNTVTRSNLKNKASEGNHVRTEVLPVFCFDPRFYD